MGNYIDGKPNGVFAVLTLNNNISEKKYNQFFYSINVNTYNKYY